MNRKHRSILLKSSSETWKLKHQVDDELHRLGWDRKKRNASIKRLYGKTSLLVLDDEQLENFAKALSNLAFSQITIRKSRK